jgi:Ca2+-transporting ATPase
MTKSIWSLGLFSNLWLLGGVIIMVILQLLFTYAPLMNELFQTVPLPLEDWGQILFVGLAIYMIIGTEKFYRNWQNKKQDVDQE